MKGGAVRWDLGVCTVHELVQGIHEGRDGLVTQAARLPSPRHPPCFLKVLQRVRIAQNTYFF